MQPLLAALELAAAIGAVIAVILRYRKALRDHPPLEYAPAAVPWRWAEPPPGLTVRQAEGVSVIDLPPPRRTRAIVAELAAYGFGLLLVASAIASLVNDLPALVNAMSVVIFGPLVLVCLQMATRLVRVELRPDTVTFVERGGLWWHRTRVRRRPLRVAGKMEAMLSVERGRDPEHGILLKGGLVWTHMRSACNQSQGTWLVGGLEAWSAAGDG